MLEIILESIQIARDKKAKDKKLPNLIFGIEKMDFMLTLQIFDPKIMGKSIETIKTKTLAR